ncbi:CcmD family protein [Chitinophaga qingshengii]|uniref:CcmD family protein n=1 Tax=Chitinophaga qingshengii TaxID=1569794 RepID=A0ABR7TYX0_9BACT|nr:CcmD family protein [Chitinophaga qingshengii]MBC9934766.1 CcmD family protein [Chitinophaga qingshengii]
MINKAFSFCLTITLLLVSVLANAQQQDTESGAVNQFFRSNNKIYVIVGVLLIIFLGIVLFLINLDRKISKLEQRDKK